MNFEKLKSTAQILLLVIIAMEGEAQRQLPTIYNGNISINSVRSWELVRPLNDRNLVTIGSSVQTARLVTQYIDGLGRPVQTVAKQGSLVTGGVAVDLVHMLEYDELGRERFSFLPSPGSNVGDNNHVSDGLFKMNPFQQQEAFYNGYLANQVGEVVGNKNWAYSQVNFEPSPLNRPLETFSPGGSWVGTEGEAAETNRRSVKIKYWLNQTSDSVRIWNVIEGGVGSWSN